jgi:hypothetical protein
MKARLVTRKNYVSKKDQGLTTLEASLLPNVNQKNDRRAQSSIATVFEINAQGVPKINLASERMVNLRQ